MILVDFAHLCNRYIFTAIANSKPKKIKGKAVTEDFSGLFIHGVITNLLFLSKEFSKEYGELVLALEGKSWRKEFYPEYKAHRVKKKTESDVNWDEIYPIIDDLSSSLKEHFGVKAIKVYRAEGDDVIAALIKNSSEKSLIVSSDKDFKQLCVYRHANLYDPIKKKMVEFESNEEVENELFKHIIKGDETDNIPSVVSKEKFTPEFISFLQQNDVFVTSPGEFFKLDISQHLIDKYDVFEKYISGKQKGENKETKAIFKKTAITSNKLKEIEQEIKEGNNQWLLEQYNFNKKLIDLSEIPEDVEKSILNEFDNLKSIEANPMEMVNFCAKYRLMSLVKEIQFFHMKDVKCSELSLDSSEW